MQEQNRQAPHQTSNTINITATRTHALNNSPQKTETTVGWHKPKNKPYSINIRPPPRTTKKPKVETREQSDVLTHYLTPHSTQNIKESSAQPK
jgi:hypothetical protein